MTKFTDAFGEKYQANRKNLLTRSFELGGHTFKVRIPLVSESDAIYKKVSEPDTDMVEKIYVEITASLRQFEATQTEDFKFTDNDVIVDGRSMREAAKNKAITEARITEFFKLLIPAVEGASLDDLTYQDIEDEFPFSVQMQIVDKIGEVISPTYKEARGN
jgi:regulator of RNase E activity RraB